MKSQIKLLGVDDGPFDFQDEKTILIGVVMRANGYIEGVLKKEIVIDGMEASQVLIDMINTTAHHQQIRALLLDGVAVGGFNIVDLQQVFQETQIPVITITRDKPDYERIKNALQSHFTDWEKRYALIEKGSILPMKTAHNPLYFNFVGLDEQRAKEIITISTIRGVIPEPIRVAHLIASGMKRGESYGKA